MSDEYTPTMAELREVWAQFSECGGIAIRHSGSGDLIDDRYHEFDRVIAAHDAEVAAKTLEDAADGLDSHIRYPDSPSFDAAARIVNSATANAANWLRARAAGIRGGQ